MKMVQLSHASRLDRRTLLFGLGLSVVATQVSAQSPMVAIASPEQFRATELMGGDFAIQTSRLALERSRNPSVRNFAQLEINEQTAIAAALGTRPGGVPLRPDQAEIIQQLASMPRGERFDRAYVLGQIAGHQELLSLNTAYASNGFDNVGRSVATVAVPTIQTHLSIFSDLRRRA